MDYSNFKKLRQVTKTFGFDAEKVEIAEAYFDKVTLFSGEELPVDSSRDLSGECDFFFVLAPVNPI
jgi:hypothetical protein